MPVETTNSLFRPTTRPLTLREKANLQTMLKEDEAFRASRVQLMIAVADNAEARQIPIVEHPAVLAHFRNWRKKNASVDRKSKI